jgi:uncharacterized protein YbaR (Trm112 family)
MYIVLTDSLTCPRCGPDFGLILLANRVEERRVIDGSLGCSNCRETYPIASGAADLRVIALSTDAPASDPSPEAALRIAALLGLNDARGPVLLAGPGTVNASGVAALVPEVEVVAFTPEPLAGDEPERVSRVAGGPRLPFRGGSMRGVALTGGADAALLAEAARVLAPGARILVDPASPETAALLADAGAETLLEQDGAVLAWRSGAAPRPTRHGG